jgi:hypothetical protein
MSADGADEAYIEKHQDFPALVGVMTNNYLTVILSMCYEIKFFKVFVIFFAGGKAKKPPKTIAILLLNPGLKPWAIQFNHVRLPFMFYYNFQ